ncbi:protein-glutamate methylesterase/protein-glutamine glutaminase [Paenibacillus campinasensis]|uniref:Protein-glutamate methylesterase/protein-glutamine glutaminase n=1 Tax=Paenibacillus campinasensis TaxID=66347 RepID=A0A268ES51_9BACL|nr:chemotaxis response regulator protein-glutamate methylesterase [Paenibacillus campinasensis]PAD75962.1 chemotaxis response regulator protein-glutamate methylesterase [Paenibacillus campinasensis]
MPPFRVLVVDDSAFMRKIISDLIERDELFTVVGTATNGRDAIEQMKELDPDVITLDVEMPVMNGLDALKIMMQEGPRPVIMLSGINEQGMKETILALESGAFDFIRKPSITNAMDIEQVRQELMKQLHVAMQAKARRAQWEEEERLRAEAGRADAKEVKHAPPAAKTTFPLTKPSDLSSGGQSGMKQAKPKASSAAKPERSGKPERAEKKLPEPKEFKKRVQKLPASQPIEVRRTLESSKPAVQEQRGIPDAGRPDMQKPASAAAAASDFSSLVAIGCSTGGPRALKTFLEKIPGDFPAPIVIVQHMPPKFTRSLAQRLNSFSSVQVVEAEHGMPLQAGHAYIAPGGSHILVEQLPSGQLGIKTTDDAPRSGHRPSVDVMFESLMPLTSLKRHLVLMTGMGSDGAKMMKKLYDAGVTSTFAESEETCVVYGMPRSAVELGCVTHILPLHEIAPRLVQAVNNGK